MSGDMNGNGNVESVATAIHEAYDAYQSRFRAITRRASERFVRREWREAQRDASERIVLYKHRVDEVLAQARSMLGDCVTDVASWEEIKWMHSALIADRADCEIAESFFNSVTRRIFATVGVNPLVEYVFPDNEPGDIDDGPPVTRRYAWRGDTANVVRRVLHDLSWDARWRDMDGDAERVAERIDAELLTVRGSLGFDAIELLEAPFFRNKGAYLVGRLLREDGHPPMPLLLPLLNGEEGIEVDAVLLSEDEASIVFGFSWSYFLVEIARPHAVVDFLHGIMPLKRIDELYNAIGYNKHGKTELYRTLVAHLAGPGARFEFAPGDQGLVMSVFTLPSLNVVFKIIKDRFGHPKRTTRRSVMEKYQLVFVRDRVGRLADAQEFEHLDLPRACFSEPLLAHLLDAAASTVRLNGDHVVVRHLYTERRVTPLNVYLRDASPMTAAEAVLDYGTAIKDLAAANIFTGDMLMKNFGVSRHGRVIFYDYDELSLLTDCVFRKLPEATTPDQEMAAEPWYYVGENDVFPEEFEAFMVPQGRLRKRFLQRHRDLLTVDFWKSMQERQLHGDIPDVFPYPESRRLRHT
jgi:isocitrate dehydrogenase kinase/phosphatase